MIKWDSTLSKLIGTKVPVETAGENHAEGAQGNSSTHAESRKDNGDAGDLNGDDSDDDKAEPDAPTNSLDELGNIEFNYDPNDPAGLKLSKLSANDAARYHLIKSVCERAGRLEEWKDSLNAAAHEASSTLSTQTLTDGRSKKAAKKILEELQRYVCLLAILPNIIPIISLQAMHTYALYGISVNGIILGTNMAAPSTMLHPTFFGPEPKFVDALREMLWCPQQVQQYLVSLGM